ncbi:MAG: hypothetical protein Q4G52_12725 [Clostridia bacterium]|nr:hypothetical protein [Clostridia bacterium]
MNTTKTIERTSTVLGGRCEETQKNMKRLMAQAGVGEYKSVRTMIPQIPGSKDDVVFVGLNGVKFYFMRGRSQEIPEPLVQVLSDCAVI